MHNFQSYLTKSTMIKIDASSLPTPVILLHHKRVYSLGIKLSQDFSYTLHQC